MPDPAVPAIDGIRVGVGGWTFAPWRSNFYPQGLVQRRELEFASRQLSAIEINGTYYGTQKPATYAKWRDETPPGFVFSAKAPKRITQSRQLAATGAQVEDFIGGIATLQDRLGPLVWQFDAGTRVDHAALDAFLALLPRKVDGRALRHVLDVRDPRAVDAGLVALARQHGVDLRPVDSEHSAIWQALMTGERKDLARIILTASGGPFLDKSAEELASVTVADALAHPNWSMGSKITVDSASMMNKGLEIIEAHHLFDVPYDQIDVVVHREQIIHSLVEWDDRSSIAQLSFPDMRLPIQYALTWPDRPVSPGSPLDFTRIAQMSFQLPNEEQFPLLRLARQAGIEGGTAPTVLSAADEVAVHAFLDGKIGFIDIPAIVQQTLDAHDTAGVTNLDVVFAADEWARAHARDLVDRRT